MKLNAQDRLHLLNILPREGEIGRIRTSHKLRMLLDLSADEQGKIEFRQLPNSSVEWDTDLALELEGDFALDGEMKALVVETLKALDTEKKLIEVHIPLWEKFVDATDPVA